MDSLTLKMEAAGYSETSVNIYQSTRRNIPGDYNVQQYHREIFKSRNVEIVLVGDQPDAQFLL